MGKSKTSVLFICRNNSARSQMAEGLLNAMYGVNYEAFSAGITPTIVNSYAVEVMKEIGIDLSKHYSKSIDDFKDKKFDYVVTVCDSAKETCPFFPGKKTLHRNFKDPVESESSIEEALDAFRKVRDEIKKWITETFGQKKYSSSTDTILPR
jgi:arsenate reductase